MQIDPAGNGRSPIDAQALDDRASALSAREDAFRLLQDSFSARSRAKEEELAAREAALQARESQNDDLRQANEKLVMATLAAQELREAAEMLRRRQDVFLAMLAHELRNPLAAVSAAVEIVVRKAEGLIPEKLLLGVRRQIKHLVRLIDDLLDASRVSEGKVVLQRRVTSVQEFVQQAVDACRDDIATRGHRLVVDFPSRPVTVDGDPVRLTQAVTNLVQNASKYTPDGGEIRVAVSTEGADVQIRVSDNGVGISPETLPHVFDLFVQDERPLSRSQGGLGIGLTIVRRMVELHGGRVEGQSGGRDAGSEFTVHLPVAVALDARQEPGQAPAGDEAPARARILIVEDNADVGEMLAELLRESGHEVRIALDGPSGLAGFEQLRPQVVLCDIGLPGLDGYEVAARMRQLNHDPRPVLIALTGYGGAANVDRALRAGFDRHLVKPVDVEVILQWIRMAMQVGAGPAA